MNYRLMWMHIGMTTEQNSEEGNFRDSISQKEINFTQKKPSKNVSNFSHYWPCCPFMKLYLSQFHSFRNHSLEKWYFNSMSRTSLKEDKISVLMLHKYDVIHILLLVWWGDIWAFTKIVRQWFYFVCAIIFVYVKFSCKNLNKFWFFFHAFSFFVSD